MLTVADVMRAALDCGMADSVKHSDIVVMIGTYFDMGNQVAVSVDAPGLNKFALQWPRSASIETVKADIAARLTA
jgi:hypothetical protein